MPLKNKQWAPVRIIDDQPAAEKRYFGYDAYTETFAGLIANKENATPLVMGIYGEIGTGKTSLMKAMASRLDEGGLGDPEDYRHCKTVWFNAWKHEGKDALMASMVESVFKAMDSDGFFSLAKSKMDDLTKRIDQSKIFSSVSHLAAGADISEFFSDMIYKENLGFYDTFQKFFNDLVWTFLNWRFKLTEEDNPDDKNAALVVFIDDLDLCGRPHIVKVMETIKLFMARAGWIFVLGADKKVINDALSEKWGQKAAEQYMDKMVQVGFNLPQIPVKDFEALLSFAGSGADLIRDHLHLLIPAMGHNPRRLKRFINTAHVVHGLVQSAGIDLSFEKIVIWALIEQVYHDLADKIKDHPHNLTVLQKQIKKLRAATGESSTWAFTQSQLMEKRVPHTLCAYFQKPALVEMLEAFDVTSEQFVAVQTCYSAADFTDWPSASKGWWTLSLVDDPSKAVASGPFLFGVDKATATIDAPFDTDIYPVTNGRFRSFVEAGGYANPTWWSESGWQWRRDIGIEGPAVWDDQPQQRENFPVVGISWHEAEAYSRWAAKELPTEQQWERAARGVDGWEYPWGNDFDDCRCNSLGSGKGASTPVDLYSNGVSPEGCYDMAGNTWEWTATTEGDGKVTCIVKGGSWSDADDSAKCSSRRGLAPELRHPAVGFRCVRNH